MKLFVMSDIHGSLEGLKRGLERFEREKAGQLILLGDYLYHGPRNVLPAGYNPKETAETLNAYKEQIVAVRGNCDAEVDQMLLDFPMMGDYALLYWEGRKVFVTHGHLYNAEHMPALAKGNIVLHGHTHIPAAECRDGTYILNPGSVSLPKGNHPASYGVLESGSFQIKDLEDGNVFMRIAFDG